MLFFSLDYFGYMPRIDRLHIPGGITGLGLECLCRFEYTTDKQDFLCRLVENLDRGDAQYFAWAVMSNHNHLLIRASGKQLAKMTAPLLSVTILSWAIRSP